MKKLLNVFNPDEYVDTIYSTAALHRKSVYRYEGQIHSRTAQRVKVLLLTLEKLLLVNPKLTVCLHTNGLDAALTRQETDQAARSS